MFKALNAMRKENCCKKRYLTDMMLKLENALRLLCMDRIKNAPMGMF